MKTIVIAHNFRPESLSSMSFEFASYAAGLGYRVIFMSHRPFFKEPKTFKLGKGELRVFSWTSEARPTGLRDFIWYAKIFRRFRPTAVIGHFVGGNITAIVSKLLSFGKTKTYVNYHTMSEAINLDTSQQTFKSWFLRLRKRIFYLLFCDVIVCSTELARLDLEKQFSISSGRVVANAIEDRFETKTARGADEIAISFLGRLDPCKGLFVLTEAFVNHVAAHPDSILKLHIAGGGIAESEIQQLAAENPSVRFKGALPYAEVDGYLNDADFAIIPSFSDNLPTVGLEALMNQTPVLVSNKAGLAAYLDDGYDCFKFEPTVQAIEELLERVENSREKHRTMALNARQTYLAKFSIEEYCTAMIDVINIQDLQSLES